MKLHFRTMGEGYPLVLLHGVFGSADNLQTIGKELSNNFKVYLVDLRNHGQSPHSDEFNYDLMAEDIEELLDDEYIAQVNLMGHSMGGKTAMKFACSFPDRVTNLVISDIAPKYYPPHHEETFNGFRSINLNSITSRKDAEDFMKDHIEDLNIRQFILKNLTRNGQGFRWKVNLDVIEENEENLTESLGSGDSFDGATLFIRGSESPYILDEDMREIRFHFPNSELVTIQGAGHWVHADSPEDFSRVMKDFLL